DTLVGVLEKLSQPLPCLFLRPGRALHPSHDAARCRDEGGVAVPAIFAWPDAAFPVCPLADAPPALALRAFLGGAVHGLGHYATALRESMHSARESTGTRRRRPILMVLSWLERIRV